MSEIETGYRPPESGELSREDKKLNPDLEQLYVKKLKEGRIGHLIKVLFSDPATRARLSEIHEDKMVNVLDPKSFQDSPERFSSLVVSIMRDKELRTVFIEMVNREFQDHTTLLSGAIRKSNERFASDPEHLEEEDVAALVYDEVSIGGGVHGAIYATAMAADNMSVKSLLVESGKEISGQFRTKNFVSINSPNVPHERITPLHALRQGNLNYLGRNAPVQIPYIESRRFPTGDVFADAATANLYLTNTEVMIGTQVTRVVKPQEDSKSSLWPAHYKVEFSNGSFVFANRVNRMTGLGVSLLPESFDEETLALYAQEQEKEEKGEPPGVMTYEDFAQFIGDKDNQHPVRPFKGKKVGFIGRGDSSSTGIEMLLGLADDKAYKDDPIQGGRPKRIFWIGQNMDTAESYRKIASDRYSMIAVEMPDPRSNPKGAREKLIQPISARIEQIRPSDKPELGRFRVVLRVTDPKKETVSFEEEYMDYVVLATGYKKQAGELFGYPEVEDPFTDSQYAEGVVGDIADANIKMTVASKIKDEELYSVGPSANGEVVEESEKRLHGVEATAVSPITPTHVSVGTWGPRTEKMAQLNAEKATGDQLPRLDLHVKQQPIVFEEGQLDSYGVDVDSTNIEAATLTTQIEMKVAIANAFDRFDFVQHGNSEVHLTFHRTRVGSDKSTLEIVFDPNIDNAQERALVRDMVSSDVCSDVMALIGKGRYDLLEVTVPIGAKGKVRSDEMSIRFSRFKE